MVCSMPLGEKKKLNIKPKRHPRYAPLLKFYRAEQKQVHVLASGEYENTGEMCAMGWLVKLMSAFCVFRKINAFSALKIPSLI